MTHFTINGPRNGVDQAVTRIKERAMLKERVNFVASQVKHGYPLNTILNTFSDIYPCDSNIIVLDYIVPLEHINDFRVEKTRPLWMKAVYVVLKLLFIIYTTVQAFFRSMG